MKWKATHKILVSLKGQPALDSGGEWVVMLHDGKFYTEGIWNQRGQPEWILAQDGRPQYIAGRWNPHDKDGRIILQDLTKLPNYVPGRMDDSDPQLVKIRRYAERIREAIERTDYDDRTPSMKSFPRGCCDHACHILGLYFFEQTSLGVFDTVYAEHNGRRYCWLAKGDIIVDIAADQFEGCPPKVIVTRQSSWHDAWTIRRERSVIHDQEYFDRIKNSPYMMAIYSRILANLPPV